METKKTVGGSPVALISIVTGGLLILSVLASGGIFLFERYTIQSIESKKESLDRSRAAFEPATIRELSRLNTRIETGKLLLSEHVALSRLFDDLESKTLSTVRFRDFSYSTAAPGRVVVVMSGTASSFNSVALQSESFSKSSIITEPLFTNVNINETGSINFDFSAVIDLSRTKYTGEASAPVEPAPITP